MNLLKLRERYADPTVFRDVNKRAVRVYESFIRNNHKPKVSDWMEYYDAEYTDEPLLYVCGHAWQMPAIFDYKLAIGRYSQHKEQRPGAVESKHLKYVEKV